MFISKNCYRFIYLIILGHLLIPFQVHSQEFYYPKPGEVWITKAPKEFGINEIKLKDAITFAETNEYSGSRDLRIAILEAFAHEPYHEIVGLTKERGGPAGIILRNGYKIAQWGDVSRVDMTFSVT